MYNPMFNPYAPQMGGFQQPGQQYTGYPAPTPTFTQPQQAPPQAPQQAFEWIRVNTIDDIKNVSVAPNGQAWIMLQNDPVFAVKSADAMGLATTKLFKFAPYSPEEQKAPEPQYVTIEMYQKMQDQIKAMSNELATIKGGTGNGKPSK